MRSVVALADHLHFGRAALALHISQPALTKQIRKVEATLGGALFARRPRQLALTRAGQAFVARARPLLHEAQLAEKYFRSAMLGECGLIRIGFGIASLATGLPDLIQRFRGRFPGVEVAMREMSTPAQLDALENRTLDFGFVRIPASSQELVVWPLFQDRLVLAIGPHSGGRARGGLASFSREPFIGVARSASASLFDHVLRTCRAGAGAGVALVPRSSRVMRVPSIRYVETAVPAGKWNIGLAFHKSSPADPILSRFLSLVRQGYRVPTKHAG